MVNWAELDAATIKHALAAGSEAEKSNLDRQAAEARARAEKDAALRNLIAGKEFQKETDRAKIDYELAKAQELSASELKQGQHRSIKVGGASIGESTSRDTSSVARPRDKTTLINSVVSDFNKGEGGKLYKGLAAAQGVINGLQSGDITTSGRVKANLPSLEGENYKPTDAEREIMIQHTGSGDYKTFLNKVGIGPDSGNATLSPQQMNAIAAFSNARMGEFGAGLKRAQDEIRNRWETRSHELLGPVESEKMFGSLGAGSGQFISHIQESPGYKAQEERALQPKKIQSGRVSSSIAAPAAAAPVQAPPPQLGIPAGVQPQSPANKLNSLGIGQAPAPQSKPAQVQQGGHTYNLNPQTGEYE